MRQDAGVDPADIDYIEAHITGTKAGDPVETNAMYEVIASKRRDPVMIGCLKSNIGHTEGSSGLCAITKACLIYQTRLIPPNIHYNTPNLKLLGLADGKMKPVTKTTPFKGHFIPVNCFGFGGANTHLITSDFVPGKKNIQVNATCNRDIIDESSLGYRLINICGRTKESVDHIFKNVQHKAMYHNREFLSLLDDFSAQDSDDFPFRGFLIARKENSKLQFKKSEIKKSSSASLIVSFPGPDSLIAETFDQLSCVKNFREVHDDLEQLRREMPTSSVIDKISKTVALQLSFVDLLKDLKVDVGRVVGESTGELACAYFDGLIDRKTALTASFKITNGIGQFLKNSISSKGNGKKWASKWNENTSAESLSERMTRFNHGVRFDSDSQTSDNQVFLEVNSLFEVRSYSKSSPLKKKNRMIRELTRELELLPATEALVKCLGTIYSNGVSIKNLRQLYPTAKYPLSPSTPFLSPLIKWNHSKTCSIKEFLYNPNAAVSFQTTKNIVFRFDASKSEDGFLFDHKIDGRVLFPATGYLMIAWSALSFMHKVILTELPVRFDSVKFMRAVVVSSEQETILSVRINEDTGDFEIKESDNTIVSGKIKPLDGNVSSVNDIIPVDDFKRRSTSSDLKLEPQDIYKELRIRGYDYGPFFQGIKECSLNESNGAKGKLVWRDVITKTVRDNLAMETDEDLSILWIKSWCAFTDSMLQLQLMQSNSSNRVLFVPTSIETLIALPEEIKAALTVNTFNDQMTQNEASIMDVYQNQESGLLFTNGIVVKGFKGSLLHRRKQLVKLLKYEFQPWNVNSSVDDQKDNKLIDDYCKAICKKSVPEELDIENERFCFLRHLTTTDENSNEIDQKREAKVEPKFENDLIVGKVNNGFTLQQQTFFKSALDVAIYSLIANCSSSKLEVLEVNCSPTTTASILSERVKECLNDHLLYNQYTVSCNLLTTDSSSLTDTARSEFKDVVEVSQEMISSSDSNEQLKAKIPSSNLLVLTMTSNDENNMKSFESLVLNASQGIKDGGFLMMVYRDKLDEDIQRVMDEHGVKDEGVSSSSVNQVLKSLKNSFSTVMQRNLHDRLPCKMILLRRKCQPQPKVQDFVVEVGTNDFYNWIDKIKELLNDETGNKETRKRIWLTMNPKDRLYSKQITGILGLAKSLRLENNGERIRVIIDMTKESIDISSSDYSSILENDLVYNIRSEEGVWGSVEHFFLPESIEESSQSFEETEHVYLRSLKPGDLSSLSWVKNNVPSSQQFLSDHVKVHYSALNFKDVLFATGRLSMDAVPKNVSPLTSQDSLLGLEYSGVETKTNRRVMGIVPYKGLSSTIPITENEKDFMWDIPDSWSLEDAATVPVVYATVVYALLIRGRLIKEETVLIHAGTGGVGLSAINVALHFNCRVFTTVGSEEKKNFLLETFKGRISEKDIFNSRDTTFEDNVMEATEGKGVDVILNSLSDDKFDSTIRLLSPNGRFLEIGKVDMINDKKLCLNRGVNQSFHGVFLDTLTKYTEEDYFSHQVSQDKEILKRLIKQGIEEGFVKPLPRVSFSRDRVQDAFRFMATGKHIGKVLIEMRSHNSPQKNDSIKSLKSTFLNPEKSYLVLGGLGGLGLEVVQWLVIKGGKHIIINSRRGITNNYQKLIVNRLKREGIKVTISQTDSTTRSGVKQLINECNNQSKLGLGGVFNSAVVYQDCLFSEQTVDIFEQVSSPKSNATIYLDEETREFCPNLDYFVTFSSISAGRGNEGQTNYNFGNSVMDSVCMRRVRDGLPGLSVQWGVIGDVGLVADLHSGHSGTDSSGSMTKQATSEVVLLGSASQRVHSVFETLDRIINYSSIGCIASLVRPTTSLKSGKEGSADLIKIISNIIGLKDISRMDSSTSLGSLGIDSLIAVEIKQVIERVTGISLGLKEVRELTIQGVINLASGDESNPESKEQSSGGGFHSPH